MSSYIPADLRRQVIVRAGNRCEYCHLAQVGQAATFHVDHVMPVKHGGETSMENLALACVSCSLRKSAKERAIDPSSGKLVPLFNPRQQEWDAHFEWHDVVLVGKSATGRATTNSLSLNRRVILAIRAEEKAVGRHP